MGNKFSHLNYQKRRILSTMIKKGFHKQDIADALGISQSTVYRELERGLCDITKTDLSVAREYSPEASNIVLDDIFSSGELFFRPYALVLEAAPFFISV